MCNKYKILYVVCDILSTYNLLFTQEESKDVTKESIKIMEYQVKQIAEYSPDNNVRA